MIKDSLEHQMWEHHKKAIICNMQRLDYEKKNNLPYHCTSLLILQPRIKLRIIRKSQK